MKTDVLIRCDGATVGELVLPAFEASAGEILCLHVPPYLPAATTLVEQLGGSPAPPGLAFSGRVALAVRPRSRRRFWGWNRNPKVRNWLQSQAAWEPTAVREVLQQHEIDGNWPVGRLSLGHRSVLAMEVAVRSQPAVVVFDNAGCSEETVDRMLAVLRPHLADLAAILVSFPTSPPRTCRPEFHCLAVHSIYGHREKMSA